MLDTCGGTNIVINHCIRKGCAMAGKTKKTPVKMSTAQFKSFQGAQKKEYKNFQGFQGKQLKNFQGSFGRSFQGTRTVKKK